MDEIRRLLAIFADAHGVSGYEGRSLGPPLAGTRAPRGRGDGRHHGQRRRHPPRRRPGHHDRRPHGRDRLHGQVHRRAGIPALRAPGRLVRPDAAGTAGLRPRPQRPPHRGDRVEAAPHHGRRRAQEARARSRTCSSTWAPPTPTTPPPSVSRSARPSRSTPPWRPWPTTSSPARASTTGPASS